ncbi:MAG: FtsQ-type POTRA domain-containing protein [Gaiellales bacterium]
MATRNRRAGGARARARADAVVVPFPRRGVEGRSDLHRLLPSGSSLLIALALLVGAAGAYVVARNTAVFGVRALAVTGAPKGVSNQVERALSDELGQSLLAVDLPRVRGELEAIPWVASVELDRAFPHTLRVAVTPERPVAVARQGGRSFLVSAAGRVIASVDHGARPELARIWVRRDVKLVPGEVVTGDPLAAVTAVAPLAGSGFPARVTSVTVGEGAITLRVRSGIELRLGEPSDLRLKLAVAAEVLPLVRIGTTYVDVSVPERPVAGTDDTAQANTQPQLDVQSEASTTP